MVVSPNFSTKTLILLRTRTSSPSKPKWVSSSTSQIPIPSPLASRERNHDHELALVSALKSCAFSMDLARGKQIHSLVLKFGLESNTFIRNSVLNMYAKSGLIDEAESVFASDRVLDYVSCNIMVSGYVRASRLEDARKVFDLMPEKNFTSYTTMILGYAQNERASEAMKVFREMRKVRVRPGELTMSTVISACSRLSGIRECRMFHCLAIKFQLDGDVLVSTNLLHMYCLCSSLSDAERLFDEMPDRNLVSWNVMLNGYCKAGFIELARALFDEIPEKDVVSWGTMIDGYVQKDRLTEALGLYCEMLTNGAKANDIMIVDLISSCGRSGALKEGLQLHGFIVKTGFDLYEFIQATIIHFYAACGKVNLARLQFEIGIQDHIASRNALIAGFVKNGMIDQARELFNQTHKRDVFSWSTMISGYAQSDKPNIALELFQEMISSGVKPNQITMVSVFSAIASLGAADEGKWAHQYVRRNSILLSDNLSAAIIDMYAKCGSIDSALGFFHQIRDRATDVSPWNAIICALAMHGNANLSLELYCELQNRPIKPNSITFIGVLSACCHAGLVYLGKKQFESMKKKYSIDPDIRHYGCMVDLLGRAGELEEAEEMIQRMPVEPDTVIWGTLLAACRKHENVEAAERAARSLAKLEPSHGGCKVLMSNIYADAGRWEDVVSVREEMKSWDRERLPGFSVV